MTEKETWKNIQDILMRVYCSDDEEHKKVVLAVNEGISEEAWQLYRDAIVIDGCAGWLHRANWITDEAGLTAIGLTIPIVFDNGGGSAIWETINLHEVVHRSSDKLMLISTAEDILTAKAQGKTGIYYAAQHPDFLLTPQHRVIGGGLPENGAQDPSDRIQYPKFCGGWFQDIQ